MLGDNIKNKRKSIKITAAALAKQINISQAYLSEIENNKKIPTLEILQNISKTLNTTVSSLIGETDSFPCEIESLLSEVKTLSPKQIDALSYFLKTLKNDR